MDDLPSWKPNTVGKYYQIQRNSPQILNPNFFWNAVIEMKFDDIAVNV